MMQDSFGDLLEVTDLKSSTEYNNKYLDTDFAHYDRRFQSETNYLDHQYPIVIDLSHETNFCDIFNSTPVVSQQDDYLINYNNYNNAYCSPPQPKIKSEPVKLEKMEDNTYFSPCDLKPVAEVIHVHKSNNNKLDDELTKKGTKKSEIVRATWWDNLTQITKNKLLPARRCFYQFENPSECPWNSEGSNVYIFELHLLQVMSAKEAWNFKRYVDNHSKRTGIGQTFILCSSKHREAWSQLELKSNKYFKKARMINKKAFTDKQIGFLANGKYKKVWDVVVANFENNILVTNNEEECMEDEEEESYSDE